MKKFVSKLVATSLLLATTFTFAACGSGSESSGSDSSSGGSDSTTDVSTTTGLAAPSNFTISDNTYSFSGVSGASYYVIYFYNSASDSEDDYIASIGQIKATSANSTYSGEISGISAGTYYVRLYAFDSDDDKSEAAIITSCSVVAELSSPELEYWYDAYANKLYFQLSNFYTYYSESTPVVNVTVTDTSSSTTTFSGSFTVATIEAQYTDWLTDAGNYPYIMFDGLTQGNTYSVTAQAVSQSSLAVSSDEVTSFTGITLGKLNSSSDGYDYVWSSNVCADSIASLDVTKTDEIVFSSEDSTISEIADGALMNFRYRQANSDGRASGFKRDFGYGITGTKDSTPATGCTYSYSLNYAQASNTGTGHLYLKTDGSVEFVLDAPSSGVPVSGSFTGGWLYLDDAQTTVAVNIQIDYLVSLFAAA